MIGPGLRNTLADVVRHKFGNAFNRRTFAFTANCSDQSYSRCVPFHMMELIAFCSVFGIKELVRGNGFDP